MARVVLAALIPAIALTADYEIGAGDVLKVIVIGQAEMTGNFAVDTEGMVSFPILGKVKASANTTLEVERKITILLADGILKRPQVTVTVAEYGSQKVFVTGEVQRPGQYPLKSDRTLLALLGDVGGLGPNVGHEVIVVRPPAGSGSPALLSVTEAPEPASEPPSGAPLSEATPATTGATPTNLNETVEVYLDKVLISNVYFRVFGRLGQLASDGDITIVSPDGVETAVRDDRIREAGAELGYQFRSRVRIGVTATYTTRESAFETFGVEGLLAGLTVRYNPPQPTFR